MPRAVSIYTPEGVPLVAVSLLAPDAVGRVLAEAERRAYRVRIQPMLIATMEINPGNRPLSVEFLESAGVEVTND